MIKDLIKIASGYILLGFDKYVVPWIESLMLVFTIPQPKERRHTNELLDDDEVEDYLTYIIDEKEDDIVSTRKPPFVQEENGFV